MVETRSENSLQDENPNETLNRGQPGPNRDQGQREQNDTPIFVYYRPFLKDLDIESITHFLRKYEQYKLKKENLKAVHNESITAEPIVTCID